MEKKAKSQLMIGRVPEQWLYYILCGAFCGLSLGTSTFTILGVCLLAVWVFSGEFLRKRHRFLNASWLWPVLIMICLMWLGLIYSPDRFGLGIKFAMKSHYWLYALVVGGILITGNRFQNLLWAFFTGLLLNAMIGFLQLAGLFPTFFKERYAGISGGYNTLAILLILGIMVASFYFRYSKNTKVKLGCIFLMVVYFIHLIILKGRGGYFTFAILSPIIAYNFSGGRHLLITFLVYLLFLGVMSLSPFVQERVIKTINNVRIQMNASDEIAWGKQYSEDERIQGTDRIYMWRWAIDIFLEHPFTGAGTGGYKSRIVEGGGQKAITHPHNNFLYMAANHGIFGVLALCWLFLLLFKSGYRYRHKPAGFFVFSSTLVIFVGGITDTQVLDAGPAFLLGITTGLQSSLEKKIFEKI
ncbi:MAG: O-antigen ligase family protein [Thermodesulfobacteriota bacterium]|nr:O-antigen ligase family protein [Thermodesulfobacteriota bacterium]